MTWSDANGISFRWGDAVDHRIMPWQLSRAQDQRCCLMCLCASCFPLIKILKSCSLNSSDIEIELPGNVKWNKLNAVLPHVEASWKKNVMNTLVLKVESCHGYSQTVKINGEIMRPVLWVRYEGRGTFITVFMFASANQEFLFVTTKTYEQNKHRWWSFWV